MPDNESDHDTEAAPTAAAELAEPTTELPPATHAALELAWSSEADTAEVEPAEHQPWPRALTYTMVALVGLVGLSVIGLGAEYFREPTAKPLSWPTCTPQLREQAQPCVPPAPAAPTMSGGAAPAPAPSTVTVTAEAPPAPSAVAPTTVAELTDADYKFISDLERDGMRPGTKDAAEFSVSNAHQVCTYRASHDEATTQRYAASVTTWMLTPNPGSFTGLAELHYCSQFLPGDY
jgi:hypothetical protein